MAKKNTPRAASTTGAKSTEEQPGGGLTKAQQRALRAQEQQAELAARQRKQTIRRVALTSVAVVALIALVVVLVVVGKNQNSGGGGANPSVVTAGESPKVDGMSLGWTYGKPTAPHKIVIYEDFMCPYCGAFEQTGHAQLQKLADEGKVYLDYRPIHVLPEDYSLEALNAFAVVRKAYPTGDVAKNFHNLLYQKDVQPQETSCMSGGTGCLTTQDLLKLAVQAGADSSKVQGILDQDSMKAFDDAATKEGKAGAVEGTPTIYLDGKEYNDASGTGHLSAGQLAGVENEADNLVKAVSQG